MSILSIRREGETPPRLVGLILLTTVLTTCLIGCGGDDKSDGQPKTREARIKVAQDSFVNGTECEGNRVPCSGPTNSTYPNGVSGTCLRGYCLADGPACIHDVDCYTGNACLKARCESGHCYADTAEASCVVDGQDGMCRSGKCILNAALACKQDSDCKAKSQPCSPASCGESGLCRNDRLADGDNCATSSGGPGQCAAGQCVLNKDEALAGRKKCRKVKQYGFYGRRARWKEKCSKGTRYRISAEKLNKAREKIRKRIDKEVRYDTHVGIVGMATGGYNIIVTNARSRTEVRGLMDPSFVAWALAGLTSQTNWKSRNLNIWLNPLKEGWFVPTSGARKAIRRGQAASSLGRLGVVHTPTYRKWLEKTFAPLPEPLDIKAK